MSVMNLPPQTFNEFDARFNHLYQHPQSRIDGYMAWNQVKKLNLEDLALSPELRPLFDGLGLQCIGLHGANYDPTWQGQPFGRPGQGYGLYVNGRPRWPHPHWPDKAPELKPAPLLADVEHIKRARPRWVPV